MRWATIESIEAAILVTLEKLTVVNSKIVSGSGNNIGCSAQILERTILKEIVMILTCKYI